MATIVANSYREPPLRVTGTPVLGFEGRHRWILKPENLGAIPA